MLVGSGEGCFFSSVGRLVACGWSLAPLAIAVDWLALPLGMCLVLGNYLFFSFFAKMLVRRLPFFTSL